MNKQKRYTTGDLGVTLKVTTFNASNDEAKERFLSRVRKMTLEPDGEIGDGPEGTANWVVENNSQFKPGDPYGTWIFYLQNSSGETETDFVATASFVQDDRGVAAKHGLQCLGVWGFFNVLPEHRGQGLGNVMAEYVDQKVQEYTNKTGQQQTVYLFTGNPIAARIYERLGFIKQEGDDMVVNIEFFGGFDEPLYRKDYFPQS